MGFKFNPFTGNFDEVGSGSVTPAALTRVNDTNVTLTLTGTPATALLESVDMALGWSGQLSLSRGGTGANLSDPNADRILFWDDSAGAVTWLTVGTNLAIAGTTLTATDTDTNYWDRTGTILSPLTNGDTLKVGDGSLSVPSYSFESDPNTGIGWVSADKFRAIAKAIEMQSWNATTGEVVINDTAQGFTFRVEGVGDANLIETDPTNDRVGINESSPNSKLHITTTTTDNPTASNLTLEKTVVDTVSLNFAGIAGFDNDYTLNSTTNVVDASTDFLHLLNLTTANTGTLTMASGGAMEKKLLVIDAAGGAISVADFPFERFTKAEPITQTDVWMVNARGLHFNRYNGQTIITAGAPDTVVVAFAENAYNATYSVQLTGHYTAYTATDPVSHKVVTGSVYVKACLDAGTRATTGFTGYVEYQAIDGITGAQYGAWWTEVALKAGITAHHGAGYTVIAFTTTNYNYVDWAVRDY